MRRRNLGLYFFVQCQREEKEEYTQFKREFIPFESSTCVQLEWEGSRAHNIVAPLEASIVSVWSLSSDKDIRMIVPDSFVFFSLAHFLCSFSLSFIFIDHQTAISCRRKIPTIPAEACSDLISSTIDALARCLAQRRKKSKCQSFFTLDWTLLCWLQSRRSDLSILPSSPPHTDRDEFELIEGIETAIHLFPFYIVPTFVVSTTRWGEWNFERAEKSRPKIYLLTNRWGRWNTKKSKKKKCWTISFHSKLNSIKSGTHQA